MDQESKEQKDVEQLWNEIAASRGGEEKGGPQQEPPADQQDAAKDAAPDAEQKQEQPDDQEEELQKLRRELHRIKSDYGRVRSEKQRLEALLAQQERQTPAQEPQAPPEPDPWRRIKEDYPDIAEGVEALLRARVDTSIPKDVLTRRELEQDMARAAYEREIASIAEINPRWEEEVRTDEFRSWLNEQPIEVQALVDSTVPAHAKRLIELWTKRQSSAGTARVDPRLKMATQPKRAYAEPKGDEALEGEAYWNYLAERRRAAKGA